MSARGEDALVAWLRRRTQPSVVAGLDLGIGDDAAVLALGRRRVVITSDMLVEDVDFDRAWAPLPLVGWKALAASISDVAAMGASPRYAFVSIAAPAPDPAAQARAVLSGVLALARRHHIALAGGDLSRSPRPLVVDVTLVGVPHRRPVLRSGARPGDLVAVSGPLGLAALGLERLKLGARLQKARGIERRLLRAQLRPDPSAENGLLLGALATAMIDVSDGLSSDLARLCRESGVGADIELAKLPLAPPGAAPLVARVKAALHGGEDYCLLLTLRPRAARRALAHGATIVGRITRRRRISLLRTDGRRILLRPAGFSHF